MIKIFVLDISDFDPFSLMPIFHLLDVASVDLYFHWKYRLSTDLRISGDLLFWRILLYDSM